MPNFDVPPGVLNNVAKPLVQRSLDLETADNNTALRTMIEDFFAPDSLADFDLQIDEFSQPLYIGENK